MLKRMVQLMKLRKMLYLATRRDRTPEEDAEEDVNLAKVAKDVNPVNLAERAKSPAERAKRLVAELADADVVKFRKTNVI